ncbi:RNA-directed DNA polymerase, eukaryota, reverse transcriptase zinc-binding domain protein [Tanacetum coccineum]
MIWRFLTHPSDLWARVIGSIYGHDGGIPHNISRRRKHSNWGIIVSSVKRLNEKGDDLLSLCTRKLGNGSPTNHPLDCWEDNLVWRHPRGGMESSHFDALNAIIGNVLLTDNCDSWQWSPDVVAGYSVASARSLVDDIILETDLVATRWNHNIPIKVNVFLWRLNLNKLPSRVNLERKGVEIGSILCPSYHFDVETVNHIFFNCELAKDLWSLLAKWWEMDIPVYANISDWYDWLEDGRVPAKARSILEGTGGLSCGIFGTS